LKNLDNRGRLVRRRNSLQDLSFALGRPVPSASRERLFGRLSWAAISAGLSDFSHLRRLPTALQPGAARRIALLIVALALAVRAFTWKTDNTWR